jgi:hypothetical protein
LLHDLSKIHATFDDPNLVSRAGLGSLAGEHVRIARPCGMNPQVKVPPSSREWPAAPTASMTWACCGTG